MNTKKAMKELFKIRSDFECIKENMQSSLSDVQHDGFQAKIEALGIAIDALCSIEFLSKEGK